ncbi:protein of unknown function DUF969 [Thermosinus carboxydivorans Nor1]|uniref:Permease n=1 Tax=Thermosinus carboxydivorans Nor1 TaxID=401526 RepID=A1HQY0_9FIRM|nr:DUF969 domain-containing protein [Thermosinus carboxydivorans]EAX47489.1 protein of unknown function DUF969 [Thermosinus carboxydivorans Nor1]
MLKLIGVIIVVLGLMFRFNPLLVVIVAGFATGLVAGMTPLEILEAIGNAFVTNRYMSLLILILPVIGILERYGLRERAEMLIARMKGVTAGRIMLTYMVFRQVTVALGLALGGHPTFIRPLIAPMAEAAAGRGKPLPPALLDRVRAMAASAENYGNFFGQLIFIAAGGLLLIKGVLEQAGYKADLLVMAKYAIPTGIAALLIAAIRFTLFDRQLARELNDAANTPPGNAGKEVAR